MFGSINPIGIWKAHINTFRDFNNKGWLINDLLFVFGLPLILSLLANLAGLGLNKDIANIFVTSLSIFAGLLFNLLVLAHSLRGTISSGDQVRVGLLRSAYANIAFSILLAVFTILVIAVYMVTTNLCVPRLASGLSFFAFYASLLFLLTLLIVLKRFHSLLWKEIGTP